MIKIKDFYKFQNIKFKQVKRDFYVNATVFYNKKYIVVVSVTHIIVV